MHSGDLAENRFKFSQPSASFHVHASLRILSDSFEIFSGSPLSVVNYFGSVVTFVDVGGDEALQMAHGLLGSAIEQVHKFLLLFSLHDEDIDQSPDGCAGFNQRLRFLCVVHFVLQMPNLHPLEYNKLPSDGVESA